jgi:hypothetical protein
MSVAIALFGDRCLETQGGAWDLTEREDSAIAADLVSRACLANGSVEVATSR